jgi:hypothetical protein
MLLLNPTQPNPNQNPKIMNNLTQTPKPKKTIHLKSQRELIVFFAVSLFYHLAYKGVSSSTMRKTLKSININDKLYLYLLDCKILRRGVDGLYYQGTTHPNKENVNEAYRLSNFAVKERFDKIKNDALKSDIGVVITQMNLEEVHEVTPVSLNLTGQQGSYQEFLEYRQFLAWKNSQNN